MTAATAIDSPAADSPAAESPVIDYPVISADSHITEPPETYTAFIDPAFLDRAPRIVRDPVKGDVFHIDGFRKPVTLGTAAAAGLDPKDIRETGRLFEELHRGGWDPTARVADQQRDGVAAEVIYPTVGMVLCNHTDADYKRACFEAYNRWITQYCSHDPARLLGVGQTAMRTPEEGIADLESIKALGLRGVMMPGVPGRGTDEDPDYDSPAFDEFWEAAIDLDLPLSFHILTTRGGTDPRSQDEHLPVDRSRLSGHHGHAGARRSVRAPPQAEDRLRRSRRRVGPTLHVSHGPRLQPAPLLVERWPGAVKAAEPVFLRQHLRHVPRRLDGVPVRERHELEASAVGE